MNNSNNNNNIIITIVVIVIIIIIIIIVIIIIIIIIIMLSIKAPILTSFTCIFIRLWPTDIMSTFFFLMTDLLHAFSYFRATVVKRYKQNLSTSAV